MLSFNPLVANLAVALGIGLLIGAERERRKGHGQARAPAGIRTFAIVALLGALSIEVGGGLLLSVATVGVAALAAVAYGRAQGPDPGLTTEAALVFTVVLGGFAMRQPAIAAGLSVIVAILLFARSRVHHFVRSVVTEDELHDLLLLAAAALVILPLAPNEYIGPFGALNPRTVWRLVLLMMSISGLGHIAIRVFGARIGLPLSGLASGFASSSATIGAMGARAREHPALLRPAVAAAVLSTVSTIILTAIVLAALDPRDLAAMSWSLGLAGVGAAGYGLVFTKRAIHAPLPGDFVHGRAFRLRTALIFAAALSVVAVVVAGLNQWLGAAGTTAGAAVAGLADAQAAVASVASLSAGSKLTPAQTVIPILAALTTNTVTKITLATTSGGKPFARQVVPGLIIVIGAAWLGAWLQASLR
jgi:uncharacterized membrane protein (DUF4010 family)